MGTKTIAKKLGLSRNTVKKALRSEDPPAYKRKAYTNPELEPFHDFIMEKYFVKKLKGSRVLNDLRSKGCKVSSSAFYRHIRIIKEQKTKIIEDVVKKHGKAPTKDNVMYLAGLVHKEKDAYSQHEAAADIKNKYFPDVKPSQEDNRKFMDKLKSGNGISPENKQKFEEDYPDVDFDDLCNRIQTYRQDGDNGNLKPIDDIELISKGFVSSEAGSYWVNNRGPVISMLELLVECETNGGDHA